MPEVKTRKIIFVKAELNASGIFVRNLHVPFDVHDMIVRSWSAGQATNAAVFAVNMAGIGDIFHFAGQESSSPMHIFKVNGTISGDTQFAVTDIEGNLATALTTTELIFCLEFVEYYPQRIDVV